MSILHILNSFFKLLENHYFNSTYVKDVIVLKEQPRIRPYTVNDLQFWKTIKYTSSTMCAKCCVLIIIKRHPMFLNLALLSGELKNLTHYCINLLRTWRFSVRAFNVHVTPVFLKCVLSHAVAFEFQSLPLDICTLLDAF